MAMAASACAARVDPLAVAYPSATAVLQAVLQYPLLAGSVRILCEQDGRGGAKQSSSSSSSSLTATFASLRLTYRAEGLAGIYRGAPLYALHQAARDLLRFLAGRALQAAGHGPAEPAAPAAGGAGGAGEAGAAGDGGGGAPPKPEAGAGAEARRARAARLLRQTAKYLVDAACYPLLLASTRAVLLRQQDAGCHWQRLRAWCEAEGALSLFGGLAASLACTALEDAADALLERCIDRFAAGAEIGSIDKLSLKACSSQVASVFTAPFNYVGVIQRCQSSLPPLPRPRPLRDTVPNLPWVSSLYQLIGFGGVLALNVKMLQMKLEFEAYEAERGEE